MQQTTNTLHYSNFNRILDYMRFHNDEFQLNYPHSIIKYYSGFETYLAELKSEILLNLTILNSDSQNYFEFLKNEVSRIKTRSESDIIHIIEEHLKNYMISEENLLNKSQLGNELFIILNFDFYTYLTKEDNKTKEPTSAEHKIRMSFYSYFHSKNVEKLQNFINEMEQIINNISKEG